MEKAIKQFVLSHGADVCGMAAIERFSDAPEGFSPTDVYPGCRAVICLGLALPKGTLEVPSRIVYAYYNGRVCEWLDRIAFETARWLEMEYGATAVPLPCDAPYEHWEPDISRGKGIISMKHAAALCGLGVIGKSSLLLSPEYGNMLTVGAVLTDLELCSDPLCDDVCIPGCRRCLDACPAHAIDEAGTVDQQRCRKNSFGQTARGVGTVECNRCRTVCPMRFGRREQSM